MKMEHITPPPMLVKTWLQLLNTDTQQQAKTRALEILIDNFGSVDLAVTYLEQCQNQHKKIA